MWWKWGCAAVGVVLFSCGESARLEPREGSGSAGSGGETASGGRPGAGGSVQSGGQRSTGGASSGGYGFGGYGVGGGTGGISFPTGGKAVDPTGPRKNPGWVYDPPPSVDGGAPYCPPIPAGPVYEYELDYRDPAGCYQYIEGFGAQIVLGGTYPPGSRVAIPRATADGCAVICTCREDTPDAGAASRSFQWLCSR
jgi:hypothetical protein